MLVGVKRSIFSTGFDQFAWCTNPNPDKYVKDTMIDAELAQAFKGATTIQATNEANEPITHEDGSPVLRWVF
jgi:hypothetical protein